jgi:hypothetical protein
MVRKEFFCGIHRPEAVEAAKKETAQHNRWRIQDAKDRNEQKKRSD